MVKFGDGERLSVTSAGGYGEGMVDIVREMGGGGGGMVVHG